MVSKCANSWCSAIRHNHEGKLFRLILTSKIWLVEMSAKRSTYGYAHVAF
jgi:hypothetical protein